MSTTSSVPFVTALLVTVDRAMLKSADPGEHVGDVSARQAARDLEGLRAVERQPEVGTTVAQFSSVFVAAPAASLAWLTARFRPVTEARPRRRRSTASRRR
jgi:hypothetical protein